MSCPVHLRQELTAEISSGNLRYMLAMYWQGRADKVPSGLRQLLDWITKNGLPDGVGQEWEFRPGQVAFKGQDHEVLLKSALSFALSSLA